MSISYTGYNTKCLTMENNDANIGDLVCLDVDNMATAASEGGNFIGVVVTKRNNIVGVQEQGYVEVEIVGEMPKTSYCKLVATQKNKVKIDSAKGEKAYKIIKIDNSKQTVGFLL